MFCQKFYSYYTKSYYNYLFKFLLMVLRSSFVKMFLCSRYNSSTGYKGMTFHTASRGNYTEDTVMKYTLVFHYFVKPSPHKNSDPQLGAQCAVMWKVGLRARPDINCLRNVGTMGVYPHKQNPPSSTYNL